MSAGVSVAASTWARSQVRTAVQPTPKQRKTGYSPSLSVYANSPRGAPRVHVSPTWARARVREASPTPRTWNSSWPVEVEGPAGVR